MSDSMCSWQYSHINIGRYEQPHHTLLPPALYGTVTFVNGFRDDVAIYASDGYGCERDGFLFVQFVVVVVIVVFVVVILFLFCFGFLCVFF